MDSCEVGDRALTAFLLLLLWLPPGTPGSDSCRTALLCSSWYLRCKTASSGVLWDLDGNGAYGTLARYDQCVQVAVPAVGHVVRLRHQQPGPCGCHLCDALPSCTADAAGVVSVVVDGRTLLWHLRGGCEPPAPPPSIFADGFESGDPSAWSAAQGYCAECLFSDGFESGDLNRWRTMP